MFLNVVSLKGGSTLHRVHTASQKYKLLYRTVKGRFGNVTESVSMKLSENVRMETVSGRLFNQIQPKASGEMISKSGL